MVKEKKELPEKPSVKTVQKNFRLPEDFTAEWERWCLANGYDERLVFLVALEHFKDMPHEERAKLFQELAEKGGSVSGRRSSRLG